MHTLVFATNNPHKVAEVQAVAGRAIHVITLQEAGIAIEIPEPYDSLEANAQEKSRVIHRLCGQDCFSEDSGLEVDALLGAPGVHSAYYGGAERSPQKNITALLQALKGQRNRRARFRTVISLIWNGDTYLFEGICPGTIAEEPVGEQGFGYDPVFIPQGSTRSFAAMPSAEKNGFSHRKKALDKMIAFLQTTNK